MNEILQKRIIEEASQESSMYDTIQESNAAFNASIKVAAFALQNQWISVGEALPEENRIIALLSKNYCGKDNCYEILHRIAKEYVDLKHPDGYYDLCGENVPTSAITHWMLIPQLKGGEE